MTLDNGYQLETVCHYFWKFLLGCLQYGMVNILYFNSAKILSNC